SRPTPRLACGPPCREIRLHVSRQAHTRAAYIEGQGPRRTSSPTTNRVAVMNSHKKVGVISLAVGAALVSRAPFAQETADLMVTSTLEAVVVTARMRSESLQQIPLAETAFSSQQIEDARIDQVGDF